MDINPEIRERIVNAAQQLFEASGRLEQPRVEAVRRLSNTNLNDASLVIGFKVQWDVMQSSLLCP